MRGINLQEEYKKGNLSKRLYWELMRERMLPLLEVQNLIQENSSCNGIEIRKDGIVLDMSPGGGTNIF